MYKYLEKKGEYMIKVKDLRYDYKVFEKSGGFMGSLKDFFHREYDYIKAIDGIDFEINEGEFVGLLGANGAGKTTLIKILTGILSANSGQVICDGFNPYNKQKEYLKNIGVVLGQKSQLIWDLPASETLEMLKVIYNIDSNDYNKRLNQLCELLNVTHKLNIPVRKLSLGERIKFEIICSLIHSPKILFLDEPTIGLDITSQKSIRQFLKEINKNEKVTIILTSHYMNDIEIMCDRVIVLSEGKILDDLRIDKLKEKYTVDNDIIITFKDDIASNLLEYKTNENEISIPEGDYNRIVNTLNLSEINSIIKKESSLEDIIYKLFSRK